MSPDETTPKTLSAPLYKLIRYLGLDPKTVVWLPITAESSFIPETHNCLLNAMVKQKLSGGTITFGWTLWAARKAFFFEAEFHCVWQSDDGALVDITPRLDGEDVICFVPDPKRTSHMDLTQRPAVTHTYENVKIINGCVTNEVREQRIPLGKDRLLWYLK